jgi:hypothetical protein
MEAEPVVVRLLLLDKGKLAKIPTALLASETRRDPY